MKADFTEVMSDNHLLLTMLAAGAERCRIAVESDGGAMLALFLAGLAGSATHCLGMCGPFVLAQVGCQMKSLCLAEMNEGKRFLGSLLFPYHLGRIIAYSVLGAAAAGLSGTAFKALPGLSVGLLLLAAVILAGQALPSLWQGMSGRSGESWLAPFAKPLFADPTGWRGLALGGLLGFLPCGLLYGGLAASAATGSALSGAMAMACFALGTIPGLIAVGILGQVAERRFDGLIKRAAPLLLLINAVFLLILAARQF
jgi:sulfite exporter TauE/SafE